MMRRDFTIGLLLATAGVADVVNGTRKDDRNPVTGSRYWPAFFEELRRLGDVEEENLAIERNSGEGRPEELAKLAREVINRNPDLIVATTNPIALAVRAASDTIPIVWIGSEPVRLGLATTLAHPGGNITGVTADAGYEIFGKELQILKEVVPAACKLSLSRTRSRREGQND